MTKKEEEILICPDHDKQVPLIFTFAFNYNEYWCPHCGHLGGMFGAGDYVSSTPKLEKYLKELKEKSKAFLNAKSRQVCSELEFEGKRIKPSELPEHEKEKDKEIIRDWVYEDECA